MQRKYCYEKTVQPGSAFYYSLRQLKPSARDAIVAVHAFYNELENIVLAAQDPAVALTKLNWWRLEIQNENPTHPVMIFLHDNFDFSAEKLISIVDGMSERLHHEPFAKFEDVVIHLMHTAGARDLLLIKNSAVEKVYQLMLVIELTHYLQNLRYYLQHNIIYFPSDEMLQFGVTFPMLQELKMTPEIFNLLNYQAEKITRAYQAAKVNLSTAERKELAFLLLRSELAYATLKEIQLADFSVFSHRISLTSLRCWWLAWRHSS